MRPTSAGFKSCDRIAARGISQIAEWGIDIVLPLCAALALYHPQWRVIWCCMKINLHSARLWWSVHHKKQDELFGCCVKLQGISVHKQHFYHNDKQSGQNILFCAIKYWILSAAISSTFILFSTACLNIGFSMCSLFFQRGGNFEI